MREVEVKYHIDDLEALLVALKARGIELSGPVYQDDQAYAPDGWQFGDSKLGVSFVRLRTVDGRHYFAVKQPGENAQACLEYETEVADRAAMHGAILHMGYYPTVRVAKARRTATLEHCSLCVDDVEGVGGLLELERLVPDDMRGEAIQAELAAFVASFGVTAVRTDETYVDPRADAPGALAQLSGSHGGIGQAIYRDGGRRAGGEGTLGFTPCTRYATLGFAACRR